MTILHDDRPAGPPGFTPSAADDALRLNQARTDPARCRPWCIDREHGHILPTLAGHCSSDSSYVSLKLGEPLDYLEETVLTSWTSTCGKTTVRKSRSTSTITMTRVR